MPACNSPWVHSPWVHLKKTHAPICVFWLTIYDICLCLWRQTVLAVSTATCMWIMQRNSLIIWRCLFSATVSSLRIDSIDWYPLLSADWLLCLSQRLVIVLTSNWVQFHRYHGIKEYKFQYFQLTIHVCLPHFHFSLNIIYFHGPRIWEFIWLYNKTSI